MILVAFRYSLASWFVLASKPSSGCGGWLCKARELFGCWLVGLLACRLCNGSVSILVELMFHRSWKNEFRNVRKIHVNLATFVTSHRFIMRFVAFPRSETFLRYLKGQEKGWHKLALLVLCLSAKCSHFPALACFHPTKQAGLTIIARLPLLSWHFCPNWTS